MSDVRTAIVTGGGSGIGLAISERLAADGNAVAVIGPRHGGGRSGRGQDRRSGCARPSASPSTSAIAPQIDAAVAEVSERSVVRRSS